MSERKTRKYRKPLRKAKGQQRKSTATDIRRLAKSWNAEVIGEKTSGILLGALRRDTWHFIYLAALSTGYSAPRQWHIPRYAMARAIVSIGQQLKGDRPPKKPILARFQWGEAAKLFGVFKGNSLGFLPSGCREAFVLSARFAKRLRQDVPALRRAAGKVALRWGMYSLPRTITPHGVVNYPIRCGDDNDARKVGKGYPVQSKSRDFIESLAFERTIHRRLLYWQGMYAIYCLPRSYTFSDQYLSKAASEDFLPPFAKVEDRLVKTGAAIRDFALPQKRSASKNVRSRLKAFVHENCSGLTRAQYAQLILLERICMPITPLTRIHPPVIPALAALHGVIAFSDLADWTWGVSGAEEPEAWKLEREHLAFIEMLGAIAPPDEIQPCVSELQSWATSRAASKS